jgi:hypothetical protein
MKKQITKMMEAKIAAIAKMNVEVTVLGGQINVISIVIDGSENETKVAAENIKNMAGERFREGGYDNELEAYFCGITF